MADELNIPTHRWYQKRNHIALAKEDVSRQYIYDSGIQKIDAWINSQPWGDVYIVNRLSPKMVFDFDATYYRTDGTATDLVSAATHTRASSATYVDANGILQTAAINEPRVGHHIWNGSAWVDEGYFHESEARTNLLLNSGTLSTQSVTVTAVPHTLHFTGTGTVTLTGASTAGPLVGTGIGEQNRVSLTFTPTAGTLIVTVTGTVTNADLEAGSTPSSYIPTAGATVTRAADIMTIPAANLPWPEPVVIGPELVTNGAGEFTGPDGTNVYTAYSEWTNQYNSTLTIQGNKGRFAPSGGFPAAFLTVSGLTSGKVYTVSADFQASVSEKSVIIETETVVSDTTLQYISHTFTASASSKQLSFKYGHNGGYVDFDNITVREINPLAVSIQMEGTMTYADIDTATGNPIFATWQADTNNNIILKNNTFGASITGRVDFIQEAGGVVDLVISGNTAYSPGINVPFNIASRHGSTFINGAVDGTALTADLTPTALPYLENTDMQIGHTFMGTIKLFRVWADDLTDEGIAEASA